MIVTDLMAIIGALSDMVGVAQADQLLDTSNNAPNSLGWAYLDASF